MVLSRTTSCSPRCYLGNAWWLRKLWVTVRPLTGGFLGRLSAARTELLGDAGCNIDILRQERGGGLGAGPIKRRGLVLRLRGQRGGAPGCAPAHPRRGPRGQC